MEFTRNSIKSMKFGIYKGQYYVGAEVDAALDKLETAADELMDQLDQYRARESSVSEAVLEAVELKNKILEEARQQAADELAAARQQAEEELGRAQTRKSALEAEIESLREKRDSFRRQLQDEIKAHLSLLSAATAEDRNGEAEETAEAVCDEVEAAAEAVCDEAEVEAEVEAEACSFPGEAAPREEAVL